MSFECYSICDSKQIYIHSHCQKYFIGILQQRKFIRFTALVLLADLNTVHFFIQIFYSIIKLILNDSRQKLNKWSLNILGISESAKIYFSDH